MADPTAVAALLLETPQGVCVECIARKTGREPDDVRAILRRVAAFVRVVARPGRRTTLLAFAPPTVGLGDSVTSRTHPDWVGQVVDTGRIDSGYVAVRWRSPSGVLLQAVEEQVDGLALLRPRVEGAVRPMS
jgi:hypothetical protein